VHRAIESAAIARSARNGRGSAVPPLALVPRLKPWLLTRPHGHRRDITHCALGNLVVRHIELRDQHLQRRALFQEDELLLGARGQNIQVALDLSCCDVLRLPARLGNLDLSLHLLLLRCCRGAALVVHRT